MKLKPFFTSLMAACAVMGITADPLTETRAYYSTNPGEGVGKSATITVDGDHSDWTQDMLIATCGANDMGTTFKGSHENCVLDLYALYACWDNTNLYLGIQFVNTGDTWAREGDGPLTDYGHIGDVPIVVGISVNPSSPGMTGKLSDGGYIWGDAVTWDPAQCHVDHLFYMSGKPGLGAPGMFTTSSANGATDYGSNCKVFSNIGVDYKLGHGFLPTHLWRQRTCADWADATTLLSDPSVVNNIYDAENYDNLLAGPVEGLKPHSHEYDSFYEMKIPLKALGITREWLEENGIGVRVLGTRGESAIDCIPFDAAMVDNVFKEYAKDPSTTGEKDDVDVITYRMADIGKVRDLSAIVPPEPIDPDDPDNPTPDPTDPVHYEGEQCVFFQGDWNPVNIWIWSEGKNYTTSGKWPGDAITSLGNNWWKWTYTGAGTLPADTKVIFNNGSAQTADLDYVNGGVYNASGYVKTIPATGDNPNPPTPPDPIDPEPTDGFTVYFDNSTANWQTPHIHYWGGTSQSTWPGEAMTLYKDNVWKFNVAPGTTGLLFNAGDGDATKTQDFSAVANHIYDQTGDKGEYTVSLQGISVSDDAPRYFNLQGVEVNEPAQGIYIVRRGSKATKEVIR